MGAEAVTENISVYLPQARITVPLRNLCLTFVLTIISLAVAGALGGSTGYEMLIVAMGWPHVILGFLFYFGKVLRGELQARSYFMLLALLTLILWSAHYSFTITGFISIYFTYHVFRDEVFMYFQTRARHKLRDAVQVAGLVPFILLMFIITDPRPQHYRQDLRRVDLSGVQLANKGWTFVGFKPIPYSGGKDFYFYLETPAVKGTHELGILATSEDTRPDGEMRVADRKWKVDSDLIYEPFYGDGGNPKPAEPVAGDRINPVLLSGDYRLGQTFTSTRDNLAGVWIYTSEFSAASLPANISFHLTPDTSLPLPPLSPALKVLRVAVIILLLAIVLWKALPHLKSNRAFWLYFFFFVAMLALLQKTIKAGANTGLEMPIMFQLIVVFHYWSWYVFSFDKLRALPPRQVKQSVHQPLYDRLLMRLRSLPHFTALVIVLNLVSLAGVFWYSKLSGPPALRYVFDYSYFLYFLVFHVTFSFAPKQPPTKVNAWLQPASA